MEDIILKDGELKGAVLRDYLKYSENVQCVILNACNSFEIAKIIAEYIPYVIATQSRINDETSIAFANGFYLAIATDKTVEVAFNYGIDKIKHKGLDGADIPILVKGIPKT